MSNDDARMEAAMPVVTALAFKIQAEFNELVQRLQSEEEARLFEGEKDNEDDELRNREFILGELLKLATNLDYSDEIGRRKMFLLVRE